ncbi:helix-turn-helix domain-containing protein [Listeria monocytogenes]|nr:helix-turn-helix domain-containing protein [Listeria monocytogenes]
MRGRYRSNWSSFGPLYGLYYKTLSTRVLFDEYGNPHACVDEDLRRRIEAKLVAKLLLFNAS